MNRTVGENDKNDRLWQIKLGKMNAYIMALNNMVNVFRLISNNNEGYKN